ncbi:hypothetical protein XFF6991_540007 [Xanthomonas phaseoli pv. phaseoli]|uniref:Uncharacterized protein n=1 Tax=Xanthomonas campestris pv. phaseoli TaxID=317013 RepID=A0A7Z7NJI1_XANCH|nr:hypothetical protein XFF6991_540007 [Xanthomonas phaseoli pv. phaseoli]
MLSIALKLTDLYQLKWIGAFCAQQTF